MTASGRALLLQLVCALALLFAQQAALTHQVWHAAPHGGVLHFSVAAEGQCGSQAPQERLCSLHAAFGTVLGALDCAGAGVLDRTAGEIRFRLPDLSAPSAPGLPAVSRGPPALL